MSAQVRRYLAAPLVVIACMGVLPATARAQESAYVLRSRLAAEAQVARVLAEAASTARRNEARERIAARRVEVNEQSVAAELAAMAEEEARAANPQVQAFMQENQAEIDRFVATRVEEIRLAGGLGDRSEAEVQVQVLQDLSATINEGIRAGATLVWTRAGALAVLEKDVQTAIAAADAAMAELPQLDGEAAYHRLRAADRQAEAILLKLEVLHRSYAEAGVPAAALRGRLEQLRQALHSYRSQRQDQAQALESDARELLAGGHPAAAVDKLKDAARLDPANHHLVSLIVAAQREQGQAGSRIYANGRPLAVEPLVVENRTLVPLRAVAEALGATVEWNGDTRTVTFTRDNFDVHLTIDRREVSVNGRTVLIDVPARIYDSRTHVPLRAVAEMLNAQVTYDAETQAITVVDPAPAGP